MGNETDIIDLQASTYTDASNTITQAAINQRMNAIMNPNDFIFQTWGGDVSLRELTEAEKKFAEDAMTDIKHSAVAIEVKESPKPNYAVDSLKTLGFDKLHNKVQEIAMQKMKENLIGLAGYKKISREKFVEAKNRIQQKSRCALDLALTPVKDYLGQDDSVVSLPPSDVLEKMSAAVKEGLFDSYSIIHVAKVPDPILVGIVNGSKDLYFIAEWGNDISLKEIMG